MNDIPMLSAKRLGELAIFLCVAPELTYDELDAIIGEFNDADGCYVRSFKVGNEAMNRWINEGQEREAAERAKKWLRWRMRPH